MVIKKMHYGTDGMTIVFLDGNRIEISFPEGFHELSPKKRRKFIRSCIALELGRLTYEARCLKFISDMRLW